MIALGSAYCCSYLFLLSGLPIGIFMQELSSENRFFAKMFLALYQVIVIHIDFMIRLENCTDCGGCQVGRSLSVLEDMLLVINTELLIQSSEDLGNWN